MSPPSRAQAPARRRRVRRRVVVVLVAALLVPVCLLAAVEAGLHLLGYGHDTRFLIPVEGRSGIATTNPRYGWRFFPRTLAREPVVAEIAGPKAASTVRIFLLGGSAAMGTPDPAFGLARVLQVQLEEAFPGTAFEVVNAAMTAVNSHVVLDIARHCARFQPDLFVVYMGNNEVIGPYGPGTVFGAFARHRLPVRASVWIGGTRVGQLLERAAARLPWQGRARYWRGLEMFHRQRLAIDDPRLETVYRHFRANLQALFAAVAPSGAPVLVSTVAVNLDGSPPFASLHRPDLGEEELRRWQELVHAGDELRSRGEAKRAVAIYRRAGRIDDRHAGLHFRLGQAQQEAGDQSGAARHFQRARDLDALRLRADSRINQEIRTAVDDARGRGGGVVLIDGEAVLAAASGGVPGDDLFWEHVHLRFAGNWLLARAFLEAAVDALPRLSGVAGEAPSTPSSRVTARRLALSDRDRARHAAAIAGMVRHPPFIAQEGFRGRLRALHAERARFEARDRRAPQHAESLYRRALERSPGALLLRDAYARLLAERGRHAEAEAQLRTLLARLPDVASWRTRLAFVLADQGDVESLAQAERLLRAVLAENPHSLDARVNLATVLERRGEEAQARRLYGEVLDHDPTHRLALVDLATLLRRQGDATAAERLLRRALEGDPHAADLHARLAEVRETRGDLTGAITLYRQALELDPHSARVRNNLGWALERRGEIDAALEEYRRAVTTDPGYALAWFNLADLLLALGRREEAVAAYDRGIALDPENEQASRNRELALSRGRPAAARR